MVGKRSVNYLKNLSGLPKINAERTGEILAVNPTVAPERTEAEHIHISVHDYSADKLEVHEYTKIDEAFPFLDRDTVSWINIDGIRKNDIEALCAHYKIHQLITEDILSIGQRPKMDEMNEHVFCLLNMLYFNEEKKPLSQNRSASYLGKTLFFHFKKTPVVMYSIRCDTNFRFQKVNSGSDRPTIFCIPCSISLSIIITW